MVSTIADKTIIKHHIDGPQGVRGRNSDNTLIYKKLGWKPSQPLEDGVKQTYSWIAEQVKAKSKLKI